MPNATAYRGIRPACSRPKMHVDMSTWCDGARQVIPKIFMRCLTQCECMPQLALLTHRLACDDDYVLENLFGRSQYSQQYDRDIGGS
jgi:hypothetical protein